MQIKMEMKGDLKLVVKMTDDIDTWHGFSEEWEWVKEHIGGVTVRYQGDNYVNRNYSLAELSSEYAKQGRSEPSQQAYVSMSKQLEADINRAEYMVDLTIYCKGVILAEQVSSFDWSVWDDETIEKRAKEAYEEYMVDLVPDLYSMAITQLNELKNAST